MNLFFAGDPFGSRRGSCISEFQRATRRPVTERSEGAQLGAPPERAYSRCRIPSDSRAHPSDGVQVSMLLAANTRW